MVLLHPHFESKCRRIHCTAVGEVPIDILHPKNTGRNIQVPLPVCFMYRLYMKNLNPVPIGMRFGFLKYGGRYKTATRFARLHKFVLAGRPSLRSASRSLTYRTAFSSDRKQKETAALCATVLFGGRYKTRTCDLPHVKRMRYQLRQSSVFI